jgi:hypothetical protein
MQLACSCILSDENVVCRIDFCVRTKPSHSVRPPLQDIFCHVVCLNPFFELRPSALHLFSLHRHGQRFFLAHQDDQLLATGDAGVRFNIM